MPGYWNAHSDLDWYASCGVYDEPADDDQCAISVTARRELLRQAAVKLARAGDCERHRMAADLAQEAGELLRRAGLPDVADECAGEFGCDTAAILKEIEAELRR